MFDQSVSGETVSDGVFLVHAAAVKESISNEMQTRREQISAEPRQKLRIFYQVSLT